VLAAQQVGDDHGDATNDQTFGIDEMPLLSTSAGLADAVILERAFMALRFRF
jgi:hypothetical protein